MNECSVAAKGKETAAPAERFRVKNKERNTENDSMPEIFVGTKIALKLIF